MNIFHKVSILAISMVLLASCGGGSSTAGSSAKGSNSNQGAVSVKSNDVHLGSITTIPTGQGYKATSFVNVENNLSNSITLKTATYDLLEGNDIHPGIDATSSTSLAKLGNCRTIQKGGSCPITVMQPPNDLNGSYELKLEYEDTKTKVIYLTTNIISFSQSIPNFKGVRYSTQNNEIISEMGYRSSLITPIQLTTSFESIAATITPPGEFETLIDCGPSKKFESNEFCNISVQTNGTSDSSVLNAQLKLQLIPKASTNLKATSSYDLNIPLIALRESMGNLVISTPSITITESNPSQVVVIRNNGNGDVSNIKITTSMDGIASPFTVATNKCPTILSKDTSCSFTIGAKSSVFAQNSIQITYNSTNGKPGNPVTFTAIYQEVNAASPTLIINTQNSLINTLINTTQTLNILVTNSGNAEESISAYTSFPPGSSFSFESTSTCITNRTLAANKACNFIIYYTPINATTSITNLSFGVNATWTNNASKPQSITSSVSIPYSAIPGNASVNISPNYVALSILANSTDFITQLYTVTNAGSQPTAIESLTLPGNALNISNITTSSNPTSIKACSLGTSLDIGESCVINLQYGPTSSVTTTSTKIAIGYKPNSTTKLISTYSDLSLSSSQGVNIKVSNLTVTGSSSGNGSSFASSYQYINAPNKQLTVSITYTNFGTGNANNFNVATNSLPLGWYIVESGSPAPCTGNNISNLAPSNSCTIKFAAADPNIFNYLQTMWSLGFQIPGFSYIDPSSGFVSQNNPTYESNGTTYSFIYVNTSQFASVTTPQAVTFPLNTTSDYIFTSTTPGVIITIPSTSLIGIGITTRTCIIASGSGNCKITISGISIGDTYNFSYWVTPLGLTPSQSNSMIQQASFTVQ